MSKYLMVAIVFSTGIIISASIVFVGLKINKTLERQAEWRLDEAYMRGIKAKELGLPAHVEAGKKYHLVTIDEMATSGVITKLYPGIEWDR